MLNKIDLRIGEARILRDITTKLFYLDWLTIMMEASDWEYQSYGYRPLVKYLEDRYNAPIVITNGANQALHAAMYALKQMGYPNIGFRVPYWSRIPEIAQTVGIPHLSFEGEILPEENSQNISSYLMTMPNNPDGYLPSLERVRLVSEVLKEQNIPLIHDAVYYNRTCLPIDYPIENIGDVQIYSASKTYGLSSMRIGYMVVHNIDFYNLLLDYMELSTVGVSVPSQKLFLQLLQREDAMPMLKQNFEQQSREELKKAKQLFKTIDPEVLELSENFETISGMFAWVKPKQPDVFEKTNIAVLNGDVFGMPGYARINMAAGNDIIAETVKRLNGI